MQPQLAAILMGSLSSVSFPVGATVGMLIKLPPKFLAGLLAYGAGALLFALASELFIEHIQNPKSNGVHTAVLTISALLGALAFMKLANLLDDLEKKAAVNKKKRAQTLAAAALHHENKTSAEGTQELLSQPLSDGPRELEIEDMDLESQHRHRIHLEEDVDDDEPSAPPPILPSHAHAINASSDDLSNRVVQTPPMTEWGEEEGDEEERPHTSNVAISMWLGVMLDSIPESMYFGFLAIQGKFSYALIIGVFFANLPEAVSSAAMQRKRKDRPCKIISMWGGITISTTLIAFVATFFFPDEGGQTEAQEMVMLTCSGLAGGAMLGMVSSTMLPEAFEVGGRNVVSLSTVLGFLYAMLVSLMKD